jgi:hypothetical protein
VFRERGHVFYYPWYDNPEHNKDKVKRAATSPLCLDVVS